MKRIITFNIGSSSCKFQIFNQDLTLKGKGVIEKIGLPGTNLVFKDEDKDEALREAKDITFEELDDFLYDFIIDNEIILWENVILMVHRFVNGADVFGKDTLIDDEILAKLETLNYLAPIHHPTSISLIKKFRDKFPEIQQAVAFDTSFHSTIPEINYLYSIPYEMYEEHKIRKYGAHGQSHAYVTGQMEEHYGKRVNIINAHLGSGSSICVTNQSKSRNTSIGFTPLSGLPMGTRSGDVDPSIPLFMIKQLNMDPKEVIQTLNKKSGYLGVSGVSSDMREIYKAAKEGNERAILAREMAAKRIAETITMYLSEVPVVDALTFTGGIGENDFDFIKLIFTFLNAVKIEIKDKIEIDSNINRISKVGADLPVFIVPANEELQMATSALKLISQ